MTRLLNHLDQQDRAVLGVKVFQGSEVKGELVAEDEVKVVGCGHGVMLRRAVAGI
ncbi:hypothetical protein PSYAC_01285 [Pseudomonas syringae pv. actinidiae str. M302091]|nr:hypothetical protein PSYAC_01285 [Pseudomonas syringae pv. actinidiae str. M302091]